MVFLAARRAPGGRFAQQTAVWQTKCGRAWERERGWDASTDAANAVNNPSARGNAGATPTPPVKSVPMSRPEARIGDVARKVFHRAGVPGKSPLALTADGRSWKTLPVRTLPHSRCHLQPLRSRPPLLLRRLCRSGTMQRRSCCGEALSGHAARPSCPR